MPREFVKFAFNSGELSEDLHGRGDLQGFQTGFREGLNVIADWKGSLRTRPGTLMCEPVFEDSDNPGVRLSNFSYDTKPENNYLLLWIHNRLRFIQNGKYLLDHSTTELGNAMTYSAGSLVHVHVEDSGRRGKYLFTGQVVDVDTVRIPYRSQTLDLTANHRTIAAFNIPTPYRHQDLHALKFDQYRNDLVITHPEYPPNILRRTLRGGRIFFNISQLAFQPTLTPANMRHTLGTRTTRQDEFVGGFGWTVGVVDGDGVENPIAWSTGNLVNELDIGKDIAELKWDAYDGASKYRIYSTQFRPDFGDFAEDLLADPEILPRFADIPNLTFQRGKAVNYQLPGSPTGKAPLVYTISRLPTGLAFDDSTLRLSGTPTSNGLSSILYTVTDANDNSDNVQFNITIQEAAVDAGSFPSLTAINNIDGRVGRSLSVQLPQSPTGDAPVVYTVSELPAGLTYNAASRRIEGTPIRAQTITVVYTATDGNSDIASQSFVITIAADSTPTLPSVADRSGIKSVTITKFTLPLASGGDAPITYAVSGLPAGLSFNKSTREVSGTPTEHGSFEVTYTATDKDDDEVSRTFSYTLRDNSSPVLAARSFSYQEDTNISFQLPAATGGDGTITYSVGTLPAGLVWSVGTRTISGTVTTANTYKFTYTATDTDGDTDTVDITLTITATPDKMPSLANYSLSFEAGAAISFVLRAGSGGDGALTYTTGSLPTGLEFTSATRTISGRISSANTYTFEYTVEDTDGDTATATVTLTIREADVNPVLDDYSRSFTAGTSINIILPVAVGGNGTITYSVSNLPSGLSFTPGSRRVTGRINTPNTYTFQYTAEDADGDTDTADVVFTISRALNPPGVPRSLQITGFTSDSLSGSFVAPAGGGTPTTYRIAYSENNSIDQSDPTITTTKLTFTIESLTKDTTYYIAVRAENNDGNSAYTSVVSGTPQSQTPTRDSSRDFSIPNSNSYSHINFTEGKTFYRRNSSSNWLYIAGTAAASSGYTHTRDSLNREIYLWTAISDTALLGANPASTGGTSAIYSYTLTNGRWVRGSKVLTFNDVNFAPKVAATSSGIWYAPTKTTTNNRTLTIKYRNSSGTADSTKDITITLPSGAWTGRGGLATDGEHIWMVYAIRSNNIDTWYARAYTFAGAEVTDLAFNFNSGGTGLVPAIVANSSYVALTTMYGNPVHVWSR